MPIYELVRFSTAADHVGARLANLQRAWEEYFEQFDPCRCAPCRHSGIPALTGTSCKCVCKAGYRGEGCEETLRRGKALIKTIQIIFSNGGELKLISLGPSKGYSNPADYCVIYNHTNQHGCRSTHLKKCH